MRREDDIYIIEFNPALREKGVFVNLLPVLQFLVSIEKDIVLVALNPDVALLRIAVWQQAVNCLRSLVKKVYKHISANR